MAGGRGILNHKLSVGEAVQQAAGGGGSADAVSTLVSALSGFVGGVFGLLTILILAFYLLLDSRRCSSTSSRCFRKPSGPALKTPAAASRRR
jgi:predicted PurR-regulated permease PerM